MSNNAFGPAIRTSAASAKFRPGADGRAVDGSDRGQRAFADGHEPVVEPKQSLFGGTAQRAEIGAGAERFTGTGDDNGVHTWVGLGPFYRGA